MPLFFLRRRNSNTQEPQEPNEPKKGSSQNKFNKRMQQFKRICAQITAFLFSRVGLCIVVIGYIILGGIIFQAIEGGNEKEKARTKTLITDIVQSKTEHLINEIWNMTKLELVFYEKNYNFLLKRRLNTSNFSSLKNKLIV